MKVKIDALKGARITAASGGGWISCPCGSQTGFIVVERDVYLLGCYRNHLAKHSLDMVHPEVCLWCGKKFSEGEPT